MGGFGLGDIVARKSYGGDILFKIIQIIDASDGNNIYILKGTNMRLVADSTADDLVRPDLNSITSSAEQDMRRINARIRRIMLQRKGMHRSAGILSIKPGMEVDNSIGKSGKVLHVDGDEEYLNVCLRGYRSLGVEAKGKHIAEILQPESIVGLLKEVRPDILVVTGHDGMASGAKNYRNIANYRNSGHFAETVKRAREYQSSYDNLAIFAGACQSHFEALIESGANFASSPHRVLIHAMDPVFICEKIAFSSITKFLSPQEILENTISGEKGIGGLQTRGSFREGSLKSPFA